MNFLGHIFLTPDDDRLLVGNFIADAVRGDPYRQYPKAVADGIMLHRAIDSFTDRHHLVKQGVERLRATQGRYATVVIDVIYDHVLAGNWPLFHDGRLATFTEDAYRRLERQKEMFPDPVRRYFPLMQEQDRLLNYRYERGLVRLLESLDRRSSNDTEMHRAVEVYRAYENVFLNEFRQFIRDAEEMVSGLPLTVS